MKIGIDIGGSHIGAGIILDKGMLVGVETRDLKISKSDSAPKIESIIIDTIQEEIKCLLDKYNYDVFDVSKIGVAAPGSPKDGVLQNLVNLNIKSFDIKSKLEEIYDAKVIVNNDGKCAGYAEKEYGALRNYDDAVFLCIGTGVGSAVFLNGELLKAKQNVGFELGHMAISKTGEKCNCGRIGCFETFASMKRFKEKVIEELGLKKTIKPEELQEYIRKHINDNDNKKVKKLVDDYLENVSIGLANIINMYEPEAIAFGGSFAYYSDIFLDKLYENTKEKVFNKNTQFKLVKHHLKTMLEY